MKKYVTTKKIGLIVIVVASVIGLGVLYVFAGSVMGRIPKTEIALAPPQQKTINSLPQPSHVNKSTASLVPAASPPTQSKDNDLKDLNENEQGEDNNARHGNPSPPKKAKSKIKLESKLTF